MPVGKILIAHTEKSVWAIRKNFSPADWVNKFTSLIFADVTAKTESLVTRLLAKNTGISEYTIKPVTDMLHDEGIDAFKNGQASKRV